MRLILYTAILLLFLLLSCNCNTYGQSNNFTTEELNKIAKALNEHDFLVEQDSLNTLLLTQYENVITDYKQKEVLFNEKESSLRNIIEIQKPYWYDNFLTGSASTAVVLLILLVLFK